MRKAVEINFKIIIMRFLVFAVCFTLLFLGFYRNEWQMAGRKKFSLFQKDVEGFVVAKMVITRQKGLLCDGGLLGWGDVMPSKVAEQDYQNQFDTYLKEEEFNTYVIYESQPGFQGIFFSVLDKVSPFSPSNNLRLFRAFVSFLLAMVMVDIIGWFYVELDWFPAFLVFLSIFSSQWMTLFGRNLFFVSAIFYMPMLVLLFKLRREGYKGPFRLKNLVWLTFSLVLLKCLINGYEFILPTLTAVAAPLVYYGIANSWKKEIFLQRFVVVILASLAAILVSIIILSVQIAFASGSFQGAISSVIETLNRRTIGNDPGLPAIYAQVDKVSIWSILGIYLAESYFYRIYVPYYALIILFVFFTIIFLAMSKINPYKFPLSSKALALVAVTWFSLLGTLSWYAVFKSIAYFHTHMNYLPWHLPFALFGFAMCGYVISLFVSAIKSNR
jgi:hypothetical protein